SAEQAARRLVESDAGARAIVSFAVALDVEGEGDVTSAYLAARERLARDGWRRLLVAGRVRDLDAVRPSEVAAADAQLEGGFGRVIGIDWDKVIPDPERTIEGRAIKAWAGASAEWERGALRRFCRRRRIPVDVPWRALSAAQRKLVIDGESGDWEDGRFPGLR